MADSTALFTLLESAAGYALFEVVAFEEIGGLLEGAKDTVTDLPRFKRAVKLKAFHPFDSAHEALENANAVSEHAMTDTLRNFLERSLPSISRSSSSKKSASSAPSFALGVIDAGLATAIAEGLGVTCRSDDVTREVVRGCRLHLDSYVKGLTEDASIKAQLGLGHAYSRSKVKFNPARSDNMIIQSIALLDQLDKDVNTFAMRVREWYSWHFPELKDLVKDNIMFARAAACIQDKNTLTLNPTDNEELLAKLLLLKEIVGGDEDITHAIVAAAKTSMGMACSPIDMINIVNFTQRMIKLAEYRKQLSLYLTDKMNVVAPNLSALIGDTVAARLISKAGSLTNLAKAPASTVQILGAEKALFRALKTKGNTPKYGLIYHSTFIGRADAKNKGRISRYLANKCSIATRIDSFSDGTPSRLYGEKLREQVEERLQFYETGQAPRKNMDVMLEVAKQLKAAASGNAGGDAVEQMDVDDEDDDEDAPETPSGDKKKKKKDKDKKKKRKSDVAMEDTTPTTPSGDAVQDSAKKSSSKKDKKKRKTDDDDDEEVAAPAAVDSEDEDEEEKDSKPSAKKQKKEEKKKKKDKKEKKRKSQE